MTTTGGTTYGSSAAADPSADDLAVDVDDFAVDCGSGGTSIVPLGIAGNGGDNIGIAFTGERVRDPVS